MARRRQSIITTLKQRIPAGERVLVALSGGKDSSVLLHGLLKVRRLLEIHVEACHVDYALRKESGVDATFVTAMCEKLGVVCHVVRLAKRPAKSNMEAWAGAERYCALKGVMGRESLPVLVPDAVATSPSSMSCRLF